MKATPTCQQKKFIQPYKFKPYVFPPDFTIIIDSREQKSPLFDKPPKGLMVMRDCLTNGDYSIRGMPLFSIERKYCGDIFPYVSSDHEKTLKKMLRFRQMVDAGGWVGLLIAERESDVFKHQQFTKVSPEAVRQALISFAIRYHVTVHFAHTKEQQERFIIDHAIKFFNVSKEVS